MGEAHAKEEPGGAGREAAKAAQKDSDNAGWKGGFHPALALAKRGEPSA